MENNFEKKEGEQEQMERVASRLEDLAAIVRIGSKIEGEKKLTMEDISRGFEAFMNTIETFSRAGQAFKDASERDEK